jgi:hypothetical protein
MKNKIYFFTISFLISSALTLYLYSCNDSGVETPATEIPKFTFVTGSSFKYANDSINQAGTSFPTDIETRDTNIGINSVAGFNAVTIKSRSYQYSIPVTPEDTTYIRYDSTAGKFYQYGIMVIIDSNKTKTWNLVADFSLPYGQEWMIDTTTVYFAGTPINITLFGKVTGQTTIMTRSVPSVSISSYHIELRADMKSYGLGVGTAYIDYYIGYVGGTNACLAELKLRPFVISGGVFKQNGGDRILSTFVIP